MHSMFPYLHVAALVTVHFLVFTLCLRRCLLIFSEGILLVPGAPERHGDPTIRNGHVVVIIHQDEGFAESSRRPDLHLSRIIELEW